MNRLYRRRLIALICLLASLLSSVFMLARPALATSTTYYLDCTGGADGNAGTSTSTAWKTLARANSAPLTAGGQLLLKRGCTWTGMLHVSWSGTASQPILISAYGFGNLPVIQNAHQIGENFQVWITGSHVIVENIYARTDAWQHNSGCQNQPVGWEVGFQLDSGASYDVVRYTKATELSDGIYLAAGTSHNQILNNTLANNTMMTVLDTTPDNDAGALAINVSGDDNEIAYNQISGQVACSYDYGQDGSAVEIFGGQRNNIHHNQASQNLTFTELGDSRSADNTFAYNLVTSSLANATFLISRGSGTHWGPILRTRAYNNTVYLTDPSSLGINCTDGCNTTILTLKNNIIWSEGIDAYTDLAIVEANNLYWKSNGNPQVFFSPGNLLGTGSRKVDPLFVSVGALNFHLRPGSPAINTGSSDSLGAGYTTDLDGVTVSAGVDMGVYEQVAYRPATIGVFRRSNHTYYLRNSNTPGPADITIQVGDANSLPVVGDWDGDGLDTVGIYNTAGGFFTLYDSNAQGAPLTRQFILGNPGDVPISGRWLPGTPADNVGRPHDGVGVFRPSNGLIYIASAWPALNQVIYSDYVIVLGNPGWKAIAGKWAGGNVATAAVYAPDTSHFFLTRQTCNGIAPSPSTFCLQYSDSDITFGSANGQPFRGDWQGLGSDGIGLFSANGVMSLKNSVNYATHQQGSPDLNVIFGSPGDIPVAGRWKSPSAGSDPVQSVLVDSPTAPITQTPSAAPTTDPKHSGGLFD